MPSQDEAWAPVQFTHWRLRAVGQAIVDAGPEDEWRHGALARIACRKRPVGMPRPAGAATTPQPQGRAGSLYLMSDTPGGLAIGLPSCRGSWPTRCATRKSLAGRHSQWSFANPRSRRRKRSTSAFQLPTGTACW